MIKPDNYQAISIDDKEIDIYVDAIAKFTGIVCRRSSRSDLSLYDSALRDLIQSAVDLRELIADEVDRQMSKRVSI